MRHDRPNYLLIRTALALAATGMCVAEASAQADNSDVFRLTVAPATARNPRNSESDIIELRDGGLLLGWTEFYAGNGDVWLRARKMTEADVKTLVAQLKQHGCRTLMVRRRPSKHPHEEKQS